jgi:hypothetical protein
MYETAFVARLKRDHPLGIADPDPFVQNLFEISEQHDRPFREIMGRHNGNPTGVEFSNKEGTQWAFVLEDAGKPGRFRLQNFDKSGFIGHYTRDTLQEVVEEMIKMGYVTEDASALDRFAPTVEWEMGQEIADLHRQLGFRQINFSQFVELSEKVRKKYQSA